MRHVLLAIAVFAGVVNPFLGGVELSHFGIREFTNAQAVWIKRA